MEGTPRARHWVAIATAVMLALAGCAVPVGGQNTTEACAFLTEPRVTVLAGLNSAFSNLTSDPTAAVGTLDEVTAGFATAMTGVSNPRIKKLADHTAVSLTALSAVMERALTDSTFADRANLKTAARTVGKDLAALDSACG